MPERTVIVSAPMAKHLSLDQRAFLKAVEGKLSGEGLGTVDLDGAAPLEDQAEQIRSVQGVLVLAFCQWTGTRIARKDDEAIFPTEFNHLHIAMAVATGRPVLVVKEKPVSERGALRPSLGCRTVKMPRNLDTEWLDGPEFSKQFVRWMNDVKSQGQVFLGYCGKSRGTAAQVQLCLEKYGAEVRNWGVDFRSGASILNEIEEARDKCRSGVFLFTEDDPLVGRENEAAPRDNVVFEAGFFISAKGANNCLIIREGNAKIPADLGGTIFVQLARGTDVASIEGKIADFLKRT